MVRYRESVSVGMVTELDFSVEEWRCPEGGHWGACERPDIGLCIHAHV